MTNPSVSMVLILLGGSTLPASADLRITRDHGGYLHEYQAKYARIRDSGERIIIDGICNGACTVLLGTVPLERVCVTARAVLGFNQAFYDTRQTTGGFWQQIAGVSMTDSSATAELMSVYPEPVRNWINRQGGLTPEMKYLKNGPELWAIVDPCPEELVQARQNRIHTKRRLTGTSKSTTAAGPRP
jgi:hypothetical protein